MLCIRTVIYTLAAAADTAGQDAELAGEGDDEPHADALFGARF